jgi:serine/threonine protein kinase
MDLPYHSSLSSSSSSSSSSNTGRGGGDIATCMITKRYPFTLQQLIRFRSSSSSSNGSNGSNGINGGIGAYPDSSMSGNDNDNGNGGILSENEIIHLSFQLCDVLAHLHRNGIVYRNLSCDNIFIDIPYLTLLPFPLTSFPLLSFLIISYIGLHESNIILSNFTHSFDFRDHRRNHSHSSLHSDNINGNGNGNDESDYSNGDDEVISFDVRYSPATGKKTPIKPSSLLSTSLSTSSILSLSLAPEIILLIKEAERTGESTLIDYSLNDSYSFGQIISQMMFGTRNESASSSLPTPTTTTTTASSSPMDYHHDSNNSIYSESLYELMRLLSSNDVKKRMTLKEGLKVLKELKDRKNGHCLTCNHNHFRHKK